MIQVGACSFLYPMIAMKLPLGKQAALQYDYIASYGVDHALSKQPDLPFHLILSNRLHN
jgi:hypothetical protein